MNGNFVCLNYLLTKKINNIFFVYLLIINLIRLWSVVVVVGKKNVKRQTDGFNEPNELFANINFFFDWCCEFSVHQRIMKRVSIIYLFADA